MPPTQLWIFLVSVGLAQALDKPGTDVCWVMSNEEKCSIAPGGGDDGAPLTKSDSPVLRITGRRWYFDQRACLHSCPCNNIEKTPTAIHVPLDDGKLELKIHEYTSMTDQTGGSVWDGAVMLTKYLEHQNKLQGGSLLKGKSILEVGSGTGLPGIAAAKLGAGKVLLTDLPELQWLTKLNIQSNFDEYSTHISSEVLDWFSGWPLETKKSNDKISWDMILASDVVWVAWLVEPLVQTLVQVADANSVIFFAHQTRSTNVDKLLFSMLERSFIYERIQFSELHPDYQDHNLKIFQLRLKSAETTHSTNFLPIQTSSTLKDPRAKEVMLKIEQTFPSFLPLYGIMANSEKVVFPNIAQEMMDFADPQKTTVKQRLYELAVVFTSMLNQCGHCVSHHLERVGLTDAQKHVLQGTQLQRKFSQFSTNVLSFSTTIEFEDDELLVLDLAYHLVWANVYGRDSPEQLHEGRAGLQSLLKQSFSLSQIEELVWRISQCIAFNVHNDFMGL